MGDAFISVKQHNDLKIHTLKIHTGGSVRLSNSARITEPTSESLHANLALPKKTELTPCYSLRAPQPRLTDKSSSRVHLAIYRCYTALWAVSPALQRNILQGFCPEGPHYQGKTCARKQNKVLVNGTPPPKTDRQTMNTTSRCTHALLGPMEAKDSCLHTQHKLHRSA